MALPPAPPVPEAPMGALGPVPAAPTPEALATMPGAPDLGLAPVPELLPAPPTPTAEPPPEPAPTPEVPAHMRRAQEIESAQAAVEAGLGRVAELRAEEQSLAEKFVAAETPEERAKLQEQAGALRDATTVAERLVGQAQQGVEERVATAAAARNVEMAEAQEASLREQQAEAAKVRQEADVRAKAREEAIATAREQMATDRQAARALLERGPQATGVALTLSSMFTEAVRAAKAREVPNFQAIFQQAWERDRQAFADEFDRAQGAMKITGDEMADLALREREDAARQATAIAAIAEQAEQRMVLQAAQATTEEQRILASQVLPMLRQERAQREADAIAAREQAELKRRESEAGIAHKRAQARKLGAEATIAERKAARIGRGPGRPAAAPGLIAPNVVTMPDSDAPLVEFPNTPQGRKEATATRDIVGAQVNAVDTINRVLALYEDAENRGLVASAGWDRTDAYSDLEAELAMLETQMAFVRAGGGKTSQGDDEWAKSIVPSSPQAWTSRKKALGDIRALRRVIENQSRNTLASKTRLDKATRERILSASRPKGVSRTQLAQREKQQAEQDLVSPKTSTKRKLVAVDQVEAIAREDAQALGAEEDWLPIATAKLDTALQQSALNKDEQASQAAVEKLGQYEQFALDRAERELASIQRAKMSGATAGRDLTAEEKAALERAQATVTRARRASMKQDVRKMSPEKRRVWRKFPGMADIVAEVEAEEGENAGQ